MSEVPLPDRLIVLGFLPEVESSDTFEVVTFVRDGVQYIPLFSSEDEFERETVGTEYQHQGIGIDTRYLGAILQEDLPIILDPKSPGSRLIDRSELLGIVSKR